MSPPTGKEGIPVVFICRFHSFKFLVLTEVTGAVMFHDVVCFQLIVTRRAHLGHWEDRNIIHH